MGYSSASHCGVRSAECGVRSYTHKSVVIRNLQSFKIVPALTHRGVMDQREPLRIAMWALAFRVASAILALFANLTLPLHQRAVGDGA